MDDDIDALLFETARRAQARAARLRRRRQAPRKQQKARNECLSPSQKLGRGYENKALMLLIRAGLRPLARNLRWRRGEIDLAMRDGDTLVLVEVRARGDDRFGGAAASVDRGKQARLIRTADYLLPGLAARYWGGRPPRVRFDVVAFEGEEPQWLRHAFDAP